MQDVVSGFSYMLELVFDQQLRIHPPDAFGRCFWCRSFYANGPGNPTENKTPGRCTQSPSLSLFLFTKKLPAII